MKTKFISEQEFRNKITIITFICSLFVIWIHTTNLDVYSINCESEGIAYITYVIEQTFGKIITFATPMFFFISGFLFFRSYDLSKTLDKYKKRIKSILIPYIIWNTIYYLFFVIVTNVQIFNRFANASIYVLSLSNWLNALWLNEYYTLWFLKNLIIFIVASPIIYVLMKNWKNMPTGFVFLLIILSVGYIAPKVNIPNGIEMYIAGSYVSINHKDKAMWSNKILSYLGMLFIFLMVVTKCKYLNNFTQALLFIAVWYAINLINIRDDKPMPYFMSITFFTYVAHDLILESIEKIWLVLFGTEAIYALLDYLFAPIVTLAILVGISKIITIKMPLLWNVLNGYR